MKNIRYILFFLGVWNLNAFSQEIKIKRQFFAPYPQYFAGEQYIGNNTHELIRFIELHSQDSVLIQQLHYSERFSRIYPKLYLYGAGAVGLGGIGMGYILVKGFNDVIKNQTGSTPYTTILNTSLGLMAVGMGGIVVAGGYFVSSQIKIRKAIKGYNNLQPKISFDVQPFMDSNFSTGLSLKIGF